MVKDSFPSRLTSKETLCSLGFDAFWIQVYKVSPAHPLYEKDLQCFFHIL